MYKFEDANYTKLLKEIEVFEKESINAEKEALLKQMLPDEKIYPRIPGQEEKLKELCEKAMESKISEDQQDEANRRLAWELAFIANTKMGFAFIYVSEILRYLKLKPCDLSLRGYAGGSFVAYLMDLTEINPLEYNLPSELIFGVNGEKAIDFEINLTKSAFEGRVKACRGLEGIGQVVVPKQAQYWREEDINEYLNSFEADNNITIPAELRQECSLRLDGHIRCTKVIEHSVILIPDYFDMEQYFSTEQYSADGAVSVTFDYFTLKKLFFGINFIDNEYCNKLKDLSEKTHTDLKDIPYKDDILIKEFIKDIPEELESMFASIYSYDLRGIIDISKPETFDHLVKIYAISHGKGVWDDNAKGLLLEGKIIIDEVIACTEDVFEYCISIGIDRETAALISKAVKTGKATVKSNELWENYKGLLIENGAEPWFIDSCEKIKYLFSRSHSILYTIMTMRIMWFWIK